MKRSCGILLPLSSLPSPYGIGTMGKEAYKWIDFLNETHQTCWQVLPLGQTGFGDSPYQSFSSFAGNPYFIDLDILIKDGLLKKEECENIKWCEIREKIDYEKIYNERYPLLRLAYSRFKNEEELYKFKEENPWADDYSLFMAIKKSFKGESWLSWPAGVRKRRTYSMMKAREDLKEDINFYLFLQYEFFSQWKKLKAYAEKNNIKIIGDVPIYAALDSCDVWSDKDMFLLDRSLQPIEVAGVPPDAFTEDGQLWGNPLYNWESMKEDNYLWWGKRLDAAFKLFDMVRIDHFRGLESFYAVPAGDENAKNGRWVKGPDKDFISFLKEEFKDKEIIAEDLGFLTDEVYKLLKFSGFPGMKVLQFAFDGDEDNEYLPHNYKENSIVYTGTHDNDTTMGFLKSADKETISLIRKYFHKENADENELTDTLIEAALKSASNIAIIPMQDYLHLGSEARINTPSKKSGNWTWRMTENYEDDILKEKMKSLAERYFRD